MFFIPLQLSNIKYKDLKTTVNTRYLKLPRDWRKVRDNGDILGDQTSEGTDKKVRESESSR